MRQFGMLLSLGLFLGGCTINEDGSQILVGEVNNSEEIETPSTNTEKQHTIRLIHFNDLHANLVSHKDIVRVDGKQEVQMRGGIARIATKIDTLRSEATSSIVMNIGDTFHGGVEATYTNGNAIVDAVNALGIDVGVMGNWDFAYGPAVSKLRFSDADVPFIMKRMAGDVKAVNYPILGANWFDDDKTIVPATRIIEKEGVQIGFIGLTSDIVKRMHKGFAIGFEFTQGQENYVALVNEHTEALRTKGCDIVVVMSELGIHKDKALADLVNSGVDVFFSAHTHELTRTPFSSKSGAVVVEAGNDGYLGVMDITLKGDEVEKLNWSIEEITQEITPKASIQAIVERERAPFLANDVNIEMASFMSDLTLTDAIDTVVGHSKVSLDRRSLVDNSFNVAMSDALLDATHSELALTPGFRFDAVIANEANPLLGDEITIEDLYRFFPSVFTLSTAKVSGARFKEIFRDMMDVVVSKNAFDTNGGWIEGVGGISARINLDEAKESRIVELRLKKDNSTIENDRLYSIAGCSRPFDSSDVLCSYTGFEDKEAFTNPTTSSQYNVIDFLHDYIESGKFGHEHHHDIVDESDLKAWPEAEFIQPIW
jgi:S-sulfosulfanyl-L-cysteine sulfohydrolase